MIMNQEKLKKVSLFYLHHRRNENVKTDKYIYLFFIIIFPQINAALQSRTTG